MWSMHRFSLCISMVPRLPKTKFDARATDSVSKAELHCPEVVHAWTSEFMDIASGTKSCRFIAWNICNARSGYLPLSQELIKTL